MSHLLCPQAELYFCEQQKLGSNSGCIQMSSSLLEEHAWPLLGRSPGYLVSRYVTLARGEQGWKAAAGPGTQRLGLPAERPGERLSPSWIASGPAQELFQMVNSLDHSQIWLEPQPWSHS